jgi:copper chaperone CopZ
MKYFLYLFIFCFSVTAQGQIKNVRLQALGLTCAMCSNAITKSLKTIPFVESVDVDLKNTSYDLKFKDGAAVDFDMIRKKVESAGFSIGKFTVVADFKNVRVSNDEPLLLSGHVFNFVSVKEQVLNGEQKLQIINKYFVPLKDIKKYASLSKSEMLRTEKAGVKGKNLGVDATARVFNVTI